MSDMVVLVNEKNEPIGTAEKLATHNAHTPVHRGFSFFLFNKKGEVLLQQRSHKKKTWPLVWSNSCCGHPILDESNEDAAARRLQFELGMHDVQMHMILPDYRYRCEKDGIVENEFCPVMIGFSDQEPQPNPDEVEAIKWMKWEEWVQEVAKSPEKYSQWCVEETHLLDTSPLFNEHYQRLA